MKKLFGLIFVLCLMPAWHTEAQSARQCYKVSQEFIDRGNYEDALVQLNKAIDLDPSYTDAYVRRAAIYEKQEKYQQALDDYNRAITFDPKDEDFYLAAGRLNFQLKRYDEAIRMLDKSLELKRGYLEAYQYKMRSLIALGRYNDAAAVCDIALKFKENEVNLYFSGLINELLKKYDAAEMDYLRAVNKNHSFLEAQLALANLRLQMNKSDLAIESLNTVLSYDQNNIQAYVMRSKAYVARMDYPGAINDVSKAILINPNDSSLFFIRGTYYQAFTQFQSAINDFSKVLLIDNKNAEAFYHRAACYEQIADFKSAIRDYTMLSKLSDTDANAKRLLADAKARLYELNRESNPPKISVNEPVPIDKSTLQIPLNKNTITIKGKIEDQSDVKFVRIDGKDIPYVKNEDGINFIDELDITGKNAIVLSASDVYDNVQNITLQILRTENNPPEVALIAPYASGNDEVYLDSNDPNLYVEGNIKDESKIKSIMIDGVSASCRLDDLNPAFSANINVMNKNKFTVTSSDIYGNTTEKTFTINREGADINAGNKMGKTWAVFIENSKYSTFASLEGPTKDVVLMKSALANYKINNIIHKKDMTKKDMERFFSIELRDLVRSNRVNALLIWYAGHGKFINETGYWIPVDANRDDEFTYYNINSLRAAMQSYSELTHTLVVTDACESGPTFYQAMRGGDTKERSCDDPLAIKSKSSQVFSSAGYELAVDNSQFTRTFANVLANNPDACIPIEKIVNKVTTAVVQNNQQRPKFGKIMGLEDEDGTFFFMSKK